MWSLLILLVVGLLGTLVWLAGRYEATQVQGKVERDTADAVADIRAALIRNVQSLQALHASDPLHEDWGRRAGELLRERREIMRLEWRASNQRLLGEADTPYRAPVFGLLPRQDTLSDVTLNCATARRLNGPAYSASYYLPQPDGRGIEVMDLCLPLLADGRVTGYVLATYALQDILAEFLGRQLPHYQEASFIEADGTRLALHGATRRGARVFTAQQLLDLPGNPMLLRLASWRAAPDLLPNVMTALVTGMSIALVSVLMLLAKDMRRRQRAERDLADALAFRKAMEDSLLTGLRARDLDGRITYVNPAFCSMVGYTPEELWGKSAPAPYWPPELIGEYEQRQAIRLAGKMPPREGYESVFQHKDGTRFPVLIIEAPLINAQGVQTGWMSAFLDISEQRRVEELSRASQERLQATARLATVGEMASLLSHELNQPLAAISSYATGALNMLAHGPAAAADMAMAMRRIAEQAERAGRVIKSVHDFVRRRDEAHEAVAPQALLGAIWPLVSLQARKLAVRVRTEVAPGLPRVQCDRTMVEQVLLNLARNGMQAMDGTPVAQRELLLRVAPAGTRAGATRPKGWLEFSVADCGGGIAPAVAERLFTPFFTTKAEGMGLGLSLCRTVVEQHGGSMVYEPREPRGTVFRFTLPTEAGDSDPTTDPMPLNTADPVATTHASS
ncbi:MAG: PAS domain-containing sensor histidine kinase [Variovorax paradoxus]|nr:MAG: PAS domain-containing sensor histidine kinase [Variovorax paradoxus]PZQ16858.1 MAG: PAS domain-containing sensor histidine kinase [Variovorax paradoxus]